MEYWSDGVLECCDDGEVTSSSRLRQASGAASCPRLGAFSPGIFEGSTAALSANPHWFVGSIPANTSFEDEDE
jgi:hypothetical protein